MMNLTTQGYFDEVFRVLGDEYRIDAFIQLKEDALCKAVIEDPDKMAQCDIHEWLQDGLYIRCMELQEGAEIVGYEPLKGGLVVLAEGEISVLSKEGSVRLSSPAMFMSPPNMRRLGYSHSKVVWINIFSTNAETMEQARLEIFGQEII